MSAETLPSVGTCQCGRTLVPETQWYALPKATRRALKPTHMGHKARGLCFACHRRASLDGALIDHARHNLSREEVLAELNALGFDPRLPVAPQLRNLAPRLGMTYKAAERAWNRARADA